MSNQDWINYLLALTVGTLIIAALGLRRGAAQFARNVLAVFSGIALFYGVTIWIGITALR